MTRLRLLLLLLFLSATSFAQKVKTIVLKTADEPVNISSYRIVKIIDDRTDTGYLGTILGGMPKQPVRISLGSGTRGALQQFMEQSLQQPTQGDSMELHLITFRIAEKGKGADKQTDLISKYGFFLNGEKIMEYSGTSYIRTSSDASSHLSQLISRDIIHVLQEFDTWWASNRKQYDTTGKHTVHVSVMLNNEQNDTDLISHNAARPLTTDDFQGTPDPLSMARAVTYSGFTLQYQIQSMGNSGARATIEVSCYFDKTRSWMIKKGKDAVVLRHEQVHFDIAAFKTFELIHALRHATFTASGFQKEVETLQKQYGRELEQMQTQYDTETGHGSRNKEQQLWEARIKSELQQQAVETGYR